MHSGLTSRRRFLAIFVAVLFAKLLAGAPADLSRAVILSRPGNIPDVERTAAIMLTEEIEKRTGIRLSHSTSWPSEPSPVIAITSDTFVPEWRHAIPGKTSQHAPESYRLYVQAGPTSIVWIIAADGRGTLFGAGNLLRSGRNV